MGLTSNFALLDHRGHMAQRTSADKAIERRKVTLSISRDLHRRLKIAAAEDEREMSDITSRALKRFLDDRDRRRRG